MKNTVLLVVDVQNLMVEANPYNKEKVITNIKKLLTTARENGMEVIYVRHNDGPGEELEPGTRPWQIYSEIEPLALERIVEKEYNSAFKKTILQDYLTGKGIENIILVGLQTEYCMDTTLRVAFELGYNIFIPEETNTTFDNDYMTADKIYSYYNYKMWNKRFAEVKPIEDVIEMMTDNIR